MQNKLKELRAKYEGEKWLYRKEIIEITKISLNVNTFNFAIKGRALLSVEHEKLDQFLSELELIHTLNVSDLKSTKRKQNITIPEINIPGVLRQKASKESEPNSRNTERLETMADLIVNQAEAIEVYDFDVNRIASLCQLSNALIQLERVKAKMVKKTEKF